MTIDDFSFIKPHRSLRYAEPTPGVVVKTGEDTGKDNILGVYIPRLMFGLPINKGASETSISLDTSKIVNTKNKSIGSKSLKVKNYVKLPVASIPNIAPPHFIYGENVQIAMADKDIKSMYIMPHTLGEVNRRLTDMWTIMCPNFKQAEETLGSDNTYGFQIDTINQILGFWTTKNNGEKSKYAFAVDAKDGTVTLSDDGKRVFKITTNKDRIEIFNEAGSKFFMEKGKCRLECEDLEVIVKNSIKEEAKKMERKIENIKTESTEDVEEIKKFTIKGNEFKGEYTKQEWSGSSYKNKTSKWVVDSPISGFTKTLTANEFHIWPNAGMNPLPTCANIDSSGIASFGTPAMTAMPLVKCTPLMTTLSLITAKVDMLGCCVSVPPALAAVVSAMAPVIMTNNAKG